MTEWTNAPPTEPGLYFMRGVRGDGEGTVVRVDGCGAIWRIGRDDDISDDVAALQFWPERIEPPTGEKG